MKRTVLAIIAVGFAGYGSASPEALAAQSASASTAWPMSSPGAQGLDPAPLLALDSAIRAGALGYVDRMAVIRNGHLVVDEAYERDYVAASADRDLTPHQYNYQHPDWHPYFRGRDVHTLQSITKSITSALIGIAIARGEIESVDVPFLSLLAGYDLSGVDPALREATLEDLLTMRTGIEWHETDRPIGPENTTIRLEASDDWVRFTLEQPMDAAPGEMFTYNSGSSHLMSAIIRSATGMTVDRYAERFLFGPLEIEDYHWKITPTGLPDTEGGLYLEAEQLLKLGQLYLDRGVWGETRVLPARWVEASVARHVEGVFGAPWGYGYQWWRIDEGGTEIWAGMGYGDQYLVIIPEHRLVGVVNSWNVFGKPHGPVRDEFVAALLAAAGD